MLKVAVQVLKEISLKFVFKPLFHQPHSLAGRKDTLSISTPARLSKSIFNFLLPQFLKGNFKAQTRLKEPFVRDVSRLRAAKIHPSTPPLQVFLHFDAKF